MDAIEAKRLLDQERFEAVLGLAMSADYDAIQRSFFLQAEKFRDTPDVAKCLSRAWVSIRDETLQARQARHRRIKMNVTREELGTSDPPSGKRRLPAWIAKPLKTLWKKADDLLSN